MLRLEVPNLQELDLDRVIAFGHTWSPTLELAPEVPFFHGHAINIDMALSTTLAEQRGYISVSERDRVFWLMSRLGLALDSPHLTAELLRTGDRLDPADPRRSAARRGAAPDRHVRLPQRPRRTTSSTSRLDAHRGPVAVYPRGGAGVDMFIDDLTVSPTAGVPRRPPPCRSRRRSHPRGLAGRSSTRSLGGSTSRGSTPELRADCAEAARPRRRPRPVPGVVHHARSRRPCGGCDAR